MSNLGLRELSTASENTQVGFYKDRGPTHTATPTTLPSEGLTFQVTEFANGQVPIIARVPLLLCRLHG